MKLDNKGQTSAELILILASMSMIVLVAAYYTTNYLNIITNHTKTVITNSRNNFLSQI